MKRLLSLVIALLVIPIQPARSDWLEDVTGNMHKTTGSFVQDDYGFSVETPPEATEYVTNGGDANHGVRMILGEHRMIDVYPEYTFPETGNTIPCRQPYWFQEKAGKKTTGTIHLGGHKACLVTYIVDKTVQILAQAAGDDRGQCIMYTLLLTTTREFQKSDFASLQRVAASFKRVPIE